MHIDDYFQQLQDTIRRAPLGKAACIEYQVRSSVRGFIRGNLTFVDDSVLHVREFVDVENGISRLTYAYQYMTASQVLVFRYDNTPHHRSVLTHPHHKHEGSEENVTESKAPTLADVLDEIEAIIEPH